MIFLFPIGREARLIKWPVATLGLILLTTLVFFATWPQEKKYIEGHVPDSFSIDDLNEAGKIDSNVFQTSLYDAARETVKMALTFKLPEELHTALEKDLSSILYPTDKTNSLFTEVESALKDIPDEAKTGWVTAYAHYREARSSALQQGYPDESIFVNYGFNPERGYFPGIITCLFLHAGFMHLIFNMLLLWIVGISIEERWGPVIFLAVYFTGGIAASLIQEFMRPMPGLPLVGASGAVAAVMGAFLIRHFSMPIRLFYFIFIMKIRTGTLKAPAWSILILWLSEQLYWVSMSYDKKSTPVAYWAHIGGFFYGLLVGFLVKSSKVAETWEKAAAISQGGIAEALAEAEHQFANGRVEEAKVLFNKILVHTPNNYQALAGSLKVSSYLEQKEHLPSLALRTIASAVDCGKFQIADTLMTTWLPTLEKTMDDKEILLFAQSLVKLERYPEAARWLTKIMRDFPKSTLRGKCLFILGKLCADQLNNPASAEKCFQTLTQKPYDIEWGAVAEVELRKIQKK